jgi:transcriptional regulator with GAF, ATPase, and Fis domain
MAPRPKKYSTTPAEFEEVIRATQGGVREAARRLGWPEATVRLWMKRYGLTDLAKRLRLEAMWQEFLEGMGPETMC